jgi:hypothetical protein
MSQFKSSSIEHVFCPQAQLTKGTSESSGHAKICWGIRAGEQSPHQCLNNPMDTLSPSYMSSSTKWIPHYCITPGFMWYAILKYIATVLALLTNFNMVMFIQQSIRSGVSRFNNRIRALISTWRITAQPHATWSMRMNFILSPMIRQTDCTMRMNRRVVWHMLYEQVLHVIHREYAMRQADFPAECSFLSDIYTILPHFVLFTHDEWSNI